MKKKLRIDFVSDVVCPWCAIGLHALQSALRGLEQELEVDLQFQPFELNPDMGPQGEPLVEHLQKKYGSTPEQVAAIHENIRQRGAAVGFTFGVGKRERIYNTFDAHRLLHWAHTQGRQQALKLALLQAYFTDGENPSEHALLVSKAASVGLDAEQARSVLSSGAYASEVRAQEQFYLRSGVHSVPAVIINERHLISGGQPPEVFAQALRQIASA